MSMVNRAPADEFSKNEIANAQRLVDKLLAKHNLTLEQALAGRAASRAARSRAPGVEASASSPGQTTSLGPRGAPGRPPAPGRLRGVAPSPEGAAGPWRRSWAAGRGSAGASSSPHPAQVQGRPVTRTSSAVLEHWGQSSRLLAVACSIPSPPWPSERRRAGLS
jgi:hypothetical protein